MTTTLACFGKNLISLFYPEPHNLRCVLLVIFYPLTPPHFLAVHPLDLELSLLSTPLQWSLDLF